MPIAPALCSAKFSELFVISLIFTLIHSKTSILQATANDKNIAVLPVNENCDIDVAIDRAGYQSKEQQKKQPTLQVFFVPSLQGQPHLRVFMVLFFYRSDRLCC